MNQEYSSVIPAKKILSTRNNALLTRLEPLTIGHAPEIYRYATSEIIAQTLTPFYSSLGEVEGWLKEVEAQPQQQGFAIEHGSIGFIGLIHLQCFAGAGSFYYWLGQKFWGHGFASTAVSQFVTTCFKDLDLVDLFTSALHLNTPSIRVLEKTGFHSVHYLHPELKFFRRGLEHITNAEAIRRYQECMNNSHAITTSCKGTP